MYMRDHSAAGVIIATSLLTTLPLEPTTYLVVASTALLSHFVLDMWNEKYMKSAVYIEALFMAVLGMLIYLFVPIASWPLIAVAIFMANLPDIWDSRFYLTYVNRKRWPHLGHWPCHSKDFPIVNLTATQTVAFSIILYIALIFLLV